MNKNYDNLTNKEKEDLLSKSIFAIYTINDLIHEYSMVLATKGLQGYNHLVAATPNTFQYVSGQAYRVHKVLVILKEPLRSFVNIEAEQRANILLEKYKVIDSLSFDDIKRLPEYGTIKSGANPFKILGDYTIEDLKLDIINAYLSEADGGLHAEISDGNLGTWGLERLLENVKYRDFDSLKHRGPYLTDRSIRIVKAFLMFDETKRSQINNTRLSKSNEGLGFSEYQRKLRDVSEQLVLEHELEYIWEQKRISEDENEKEFIGYVLDLIGHI